MKTTTVADEYSQSARAWLAGPQRVYSRLADVIVAALPGVAEAAALDIGCGTGAATTALQRAGARVIALDIAAAMLAVDADARPPAVVGDALALPFRDAAFDLVVAAFSLNHLPDLTVGLQEAHRVARPGGQVVATAYADDDDHPVKAAVSEALSERGWTPSASMQVIRQQAMPRLATVARAHDEVAAAGLRGRAEHMCIEVPGLDASALVDWRLGMADVAPFVEQLAAPDRSELRARSLQLLGQRPPPLARSVVVVTIDA
ncbi:MAG: methyltransferase domain-containing protein [Actinomycetota bacterium]|nr:methyltransferase domain-containing protein [Actinomycetota bacterium]